MWETALPLSADRQWRQGKPRKETVNRGFEVYFAERAGISGFCRPVEMEGV